MDQMVAAEDPTLSQAFEALSSMEGADNAPQTEAQAEPTPDSAITEAPPASEPAAATEGQPPNDGTPSTEVSPPTDKDKAVQEAPGSRYEKNRVRLEGGWKELNAKKAEVYTMADALKRDRENFDRERQQFVRQQAETKKPRFSPEDYERHSVKLDADAQRLKEKAEQLEMDGNTQAAERAREDAAAAKANARNARTYADQLRANPPKPDPTKEQIDQQYQVGLKQWAGKAAVDFPNTAKADHPEGQMLKAALTPGNPSYDAVAARFVEEHPEGIYYLASLISAKTSAASVPTLQKELGALRARVKELDQKLSPNASMSHGRQQGPLSFEQMPEEQQEAELRQMAMSMSR